jgi:hypothetical protein
VACGYIQVPGINFDEGFAPFLNDVSFRIMLIAELVWDMTSTAVDVVTGSFKMIWMRRSTWKFLMLTIGADKKLILQKIIYGLVQRARKLYEKSIKGFEIIGIHGHRSDT